MPVKQIFELNLPDGRVLGRYLMWPDCWRVR